MKWNDVRRHLQIDIGGYTVIPKNPETGKATAKLALREQSPIVVAHLTKGCTTCAAGLEMFQRADTPDTVRRAVMELFERELFSTLQASGNAVHALHQALAGVATVQPERAAD